MGINFEELVLGWLGLIFFMLWWEERGPFSWENANLTARRLNESGVHARVVKEWYGWVVYIVKPKEQAQKSPN